jgi:transcriptional regulator with XRE-family HTH domain
VCRRIGMNRQQFNTYLSRPATPSISNLKKIADFFGVDESEMLLDSKEFSRIIDGKNQRSPYLEFLTTLTQHAVVEPEKMRRQLAKYHGYYFCLFYSCGHPDQVIRSLVHIRDKNGIYTVKTIEILAQRDAGRKKRAGFIFKRDGALFLNSGRLFILDYEKTVNSTPSLTILFPSNRHQALLLKGAHVNVSGGSSQRPFAARVVYQNLGLEPDLREAIRSCGSFHKDSPEISVELKHLIRNDLEDHQHVLGALD